MEEKESDKTRRYYYELKAGTMVGEKVMLCHIG